MGKILVVDDEDDVRLSLERRLTREGHSVDSASSIVKGIIEAHHGAIHEIGTRAAPLLSSTTQQAGGAHFVILMSAQTALESNEISS